VVVDGESGRQAAEAAAIRRRWITLGELLAVAAVVISGLTFWNSYQERSSAEAQRAAEKQDKSVRARLLILSAVTEGRNLRLSARDADQAIQEQRIFFPSPLGLDAIDTVDPRIEANWIERAADKIGKAASAGKSASDRRMPVAITKRFASGGQSRSDTAIYDVGYRIDRGLLDTDADLLGLSLVEQTSPKSAQARLDALWKRRTG
jgi:hypothetical protein